VFDGFADIGEARGKARQKSRDDFMQRDRTRDGKCKPPRVSIAKKRVEPSTQG